MNTVTNHSINDHESFISALSEVVHSILLSAPSGISEHELIKQLQHPERRFFDEGALKDSLTLFQCHFILFHCLYRLRDTLYASGFALNISPLSITLRSLDCSQEKQQLAAHDPLAEYYLDLSHLENTKKNDVEDLIQSFWQRVFEPVELDSCFKVLELTPPVSWQQIKVQYRRLAKRHHPDKGGQEDIFKNICFAYQQLKLQYRDL